jgi:hypothetical protein
MSAGAMPMRTAQVGLAQDERRSEVVEHLHTVRRRITIRPDQPIPEKTQGSRHRLDGI